MVFKILLMQNYIDYPVPDLPCAFTCDATGWFDNLSEPKGASEIIMICFCEQSC